MSQFPSPTSLRSRLMLAGGLALSFGLVTSMADAQTPEAVGATGYGSQDGTTKPFRGGDIREDAPAAARAIRDGVVGTYDSARDAVTGESSDARDSSEPAARKRVARKGPSAAQRQASAACRKSDLDAAMMRELQTALADANSRRVTSDGRCGPQTVTAIRSAQRARGMTVDGVPSMALLDNLRTATGTPAATIPVTSVNASPARAANTTTGASVGTVDPAAAPSRIEVTPPTVVAPITPSPTLAPTGPATAPAQ